MNHAPLCSFLDPVVALKACSLLDDAWRARRQPHRYCFIACNPLGLGGSVTRTIGRFRKFAQSLNQQRKFLSVLSSVFLHGLQSRYQFILASYQDVFNLLWFTRISNKEFEHWAKKKHQQLTSQVKRSALPWKDSVFIPFFLLPSCWQRLFIMSCRLLALLMNLTITEKFSLDCKTSERSWRINIIRLCDRETRVHAFMFRYSTSDKRAQVLRI